MSRRLVVVGALGIIAGGCDPSHTSDPQVSIEASRGVGAHGPGAPGSVVFFSPRNSMSGIYSMNPDGTDEQLLVGGPGTKSWPDISPNGRYVTYTSNHTGNNEVYRVDLESGETINLTNSTADDNWARWSPSGKELAFHSNRDGNYNIYIVNADGTGLRALTTSSLLDQWPDWSPDGKKIVFRRGPNLFEADASGVEANLRQLTFSAGSVINQMAVYSPNGKAIAFMSTRAGYPSVWLMGNEGESDLPAVNLTPKNPADAASLWLSRAPAWSRNGQQIYFMSFRPLTSGDVEVFVMNKDGSDPERLTHSPGEDGGPQTR